MSEEKRQYPRIDHIFNIKYGLKEIHSVKSRARDLSYGGVAFETESLLSPDDTVDLQIFFNEVPGEIPARARVVRAWYEEAKYFAAVEFTELEEEDQTIIEEYLGLYEEGIIQD